jgi:hypothetical protein
MQAYFNRVQNRRVYRIRQYFQYVLQNRYVCYIIFIERYLTRIEKIFYRFAVFTQFMPAVGKWQVRWSLSSYARNCVWENVY